MENHEYSDAARLDVQALAVALAEFDARQPFPELQIGQVTITASKPDA